MPNLTVDPDNKVFEAVVLKAGRNTIDRLRKTSLGKGVATTTLYVVRLKPYYHKAGTKKREEEEKSVDRPIEEAATPTHDPRLEAIRRIKDVRIPEAVVEDIKPRDVDSLLNISKASPEDLQRLRDRLMLIGDRNAPTGWGVRIIKAVTQVDKEIDQS